MESFENVIVKLRILDGTSSSSSSSSSSGGDYKNAQLVSNTSFWDSFAPFIIGFSILVVIVVYCVAFVIFVKCYIMREKKVPSLKEESKRLNDDEEQKRNSQQQNHTLSVRDSVNNNDDGRINVAERLQSIDTNFMSTKSVPCKNNKVYPAKLNNYLNECVEPAESGKRRSEPFIGVSNILVEKITGDEINEKARTTFGSAYSRTIRKSQLSKHSKSCLHKSVNMDKEIEITPFEEDKLDFEIKQNKRKSHAIPYSELKMFGLDSMVCSTIQNELDVDGRKSKNDKRNSTSTKRIALDEMSFSKPTTPNGSVAGDNFSVPHSHIKNLLKYTEKLSYKYKYDDQNGDKYCKFCEDFLCEGDEVRKLKACGHFFHSKCLKKWMKKSIDHSYCYKCKLKIRI